jgi:hypothetical protein
MVVVEKPLELLLMDMVVLAVQEAVVVEIFLAELQEVLEHQDKETMEGLVQILLHDLQVVVAVLEPQVVMVVDQLLELAVLVQHQVLLVLQQLTQAVVAAVEMDLLQVLVVEQVVVAMEVHQLQEQLALLTQEAEAVEVLMFLQLLMQVALEAQV